VEGDNAQGGGLQKTRKSLSRTRGEATQPDDKVILEEIAKAWDKVAILRKRDLDEADDG
jgi:hypothetical protein